MESEVRESLAGACLESLWWATVAESKGAGRRRTVGGSAITDRRESCSCNSHRNNHDSLLNVYLRHYPRYGSLLVLATSLVQNTNRKTI